LDSVVGSSGGVAGDSVVDPPADGRSRLGENAGSAGRPERRIQRFARLREHPQAERWTRALIVLCALVLVAATAEIVIDAAVGHSPLIPKQPQIAGWLSGVGVRLGYRTFLIALLAFTGAYAVMLGCAGRISKRWAIVLVGTLQLIVFAGPILISTDVFSYIAYARMGVEHAVNPYTHGPIAIKHDPVYQYVGKDWKHVATAYGPLYTLLSYPLAPLGLKGAVWGMKLVALLASAGTLALTWRCAKIRGINPVVALFAVGANPLWVIYGLGGAHNDLIMTLLMMAAVSLVLTEESPTHPGSPASGRLRHPLGAGRDALAGASVVAGALVKATAAALLPFMVLSRRKLAPVFGALAALALGALIGYAVFGIHGIDIVAALNRDAAFVSTDSFPTELAHLVGKPGVFPIDHDLLKAALVLIVGYLLWRTWRGYDWVAASGWTLLAISVTSTWLLPWYTLWSLPLAVVARDRRLLAATLAVQALFILHQISPLLVPVS
jgi:Glycosyltransferase family 87